MRDNQLLSDFLKTNCSRKCRSIGGIFIIREFSLLILEQFYCTNSLFKLDLSTYRTTIDSRIASVTTLVETIIISQS